MNNKFSVSFKIDLPISIQISQLDKDIQELLGEITNRHNKQKLSKIQDSLKSIVKSLDLSKNLSQNPSQQSLLLEQQDQQSNVFIKRKTKEDEHAANKLEQENKKLKEDIIKLKQRNSVEINEQEDKKTNKKIDSLHFTISEERATNRELILQIQSLEDALKKINTEYNSLSYRFAKLNNESELFERTINDLKHNLQINRSKFNEIVKVNEELKSKHFSKEEFIEEHNKDMRKEIKKNHKLQEKIDVLEKKIEELSSESQIKETRLKALRQMNTKLESKSKQIMDKWKNMQSIEERSESTYQNYQKHLDYLEEQNKKILSFRSDKDSFIKYEAMHSKQMNSLIEENLLLKNQINELKHINEEFQNKLESFETKFKSTLYASTLEIEHPIVQQNNYFKTGFISKPEEILNNNTITNSNKRINNSSLKKEKLSSQNNIYLNQTQSLSTNQKKPFGEEINYLAIDDMKPSKLILKENKFEVLDSPSSNK